MVTRFWSPWAFDNGNKSKKYLQGTNQPLTFNRYLELIIVVAINQFVILGLSDLLTYQVST